MRILDIEINYKHNFYVNTTKTHLMQCNFLHIKEHCYTLVSIICIFQAIILYLLIFKSHVIFVIN